MRDRQCCLQEILQNYIYIKLFGMKYENVILYLKYINPASN